MISEHEDFSVEVVRSCESTNNNANSTKIEARGATDVFLFLYNNIKTRGTYDLVASEITSITKRIAHNAQVFTENKIDGEPPGFSMDDALEILKPYIERCRTNSVNHKITVSKEKIKISVSIKAGNYYPEMRKAFVSGGKLFLRGGVLAEVILKILNARFKSKSDYREMVEQSKAFGLDYFNILKRVYYSTFEKSIQERDFGNTIEIPVSFFIHDSKKYSFTISGGNIDFSCSVNNFIPMIMSFLNSAPNLSSLLIGDFIDADVLRHSIRLFSDEYYTMQIVIFKEEKERNAKAVTEQP